MSLSEVYLMRTEVGDLLVHRQQEPYNGATLIQRTAVWGELESLIFRILGFVGIKHSLYPVDLSDPNGEPCIACALNMPYTIIVYDIQQEKCICHEPAREDYVNIFNTVVPLLAQEYLKDDSVWEECFDAHHR
jgi:hypothetical protein